MNRDATRHSLGYTYLRYMLLVLVVLLLVNRFTRLYHLIWPQLGRLALIQSLLGDSAALSRAGTFFDQAGSAPRDESGSPRGAVEYLMIIGAVEDAKSLLMTHLQHAPEDVVSRYRLGSVFNELGDRDRALAEWQTAGASHAIALGSYRMALRVNQRGDTLEMERLLLEAIEVEPSFSDAYYLLAGIYLDKRPEDARRMLQRFVRLETTTSPRWHVAQARLHMMDEQWNPAIQSLRTAIYLGDSGAHTRYLLGHALYRAGDFELAKQVLRQVVETHAHYYWAHALLADIHMQQNNMPAAIEALEAVTLLDPNRPEWHLQLALAFENTQNLTRAIEEYRRVLLLQPNNGEAQKRLEHLAGMPH